MDSGENVDSVRSRTGGSTMEGLKEGKREHSVEGHASGGASDYKTVRTYSCTLTALILSALGAKPTKGQRSTVRDRSEPSFDVDARCEGGAGER